MCMSAYHYIRVFCLQFTKAYCGLFNEAGLPPKRQLTCFAVTPDAAIQPGQFIIPRWSHSSSKYYFSIVQHMRMVRWMCGIKLKDRLPSKELRERLGIDDIALILQQNRLRWYGHVLRKDDVDWVKKCMEYEVEGPRPRGRPKRTWKEVVR